MNEITIPARYKDSKGNLRQINVNKIDLNVRTFPYLTQLVEDHLNDTYPGDWKKPILFSLKGGKA